MIQRVNETPCNGFLSLSQFPEFGMSSFRILRQGPRLTRQNKKEMLFESFVSSTIALSVTNWLVRVEIILGRISLRCLLAGRGPQVYSFLGTFGGWRRILISGGEGQTIELVAHLT